MKEYHTPHVETMDLECESFCLTQSDQNHVDFEVTHEGFFGLEELN